MALVHAAIEVTLDYSLCTMSSPAVILEAVKKTTTTDTNGQWATDLVPNANISPANTVYSVRTPLRTFQVTVPTSSPAQASANIVNVPVLPGQSTTLTGPLTVQNGPVTLQGDIAARSLTLSPSSPYTPTAPPGGIAAVSASATAFSVAASGSNYGFQVDESFANATTGLVVQAKASGFSVYLQAISPAVNESFGINAKGSGDLSLQHISTGRLWVGQQLFIDANANSSGVIRIGSTPSNILVQAPLLQVEGQTYTATASIATQAWARFMAPTLSVNGGFVVANTGTVVIEGAPIPGGAGTVTNTYALWVQQGISRLDGQVQANGGLVVTGGQTTFTGGMVLSSSSVWVPPLGGFQIDNNAGGAINLLLSDAGVLTVSRNSIQVGGDAGAGGAGLLTLTNVVGIGNGVLTNMQAPLKGTGGGPTTPTSVTDWIKIYDGATTKWIPACT